MTSQISVLAQDHLPRYYYNLAVEVKTLPPLHPGTGNPVGPDDLAPLFPGSLIEQEVSPKLEVPIPEEVLDVYARFRPTPLYRAHRLEAALDTPARIYYKYEGVSPTGSHKPNTAIPQAFYNKQAGVKRLATETGAGQWGSSLAYACSLFGLECRVYMVRVSFDQKPYRKALMETYGASVTASPSRDTQCGRELLAEDENCSGSLGVAISEAIEDTVSHDATKYSLGSVLNHVMLHQSVIGLEAKQQMRIFGDDPDVVIGCVGGGSNFLGIASPFLRDKLHGKKLEFIAAEPASCPTLTRGKLTYDFGDAAGMTPLMPMHTLGHSFIPSGIHAGGLRYHGMSPLISKLVDDEMIRAEAYRQREVFEAAVLFARTEGIVPAPESAHAIRAAVQQARIAKEEGKSKVILFNLSGHGNFDMGAYNDYFAGKLTDEELPEAELQMNLKKLPLIPEHAAA